MKMTTKGAAKEMAKILKLPRRYPGAFIDYEPSEKCYNDDTYGAVCVKCEACGRKFVDGVLWEGGD